MALKDKNVTLTIQLKSCLLLTDKNLTNTFKYSCRYLVSQEEIQELPLKHCVYFYIVKYKSGSLSLKKHYSVSKPELFIFVLENSEQKILLLCGNIYVIFWSEMSKVNFWENILLIGITVWGVKSAGKVAQCYLTWQYIVQLSRSRMWSPRQTLSVPRLDATWDGTVLWAGL